MMRPLSEASERLVGQPMFAFLARIKEAERAGKKVIHFEIGDPDFETPPEIVEAAQGSLERGETHYTDSMGLWDLRQEICAHTEKRYGFRPAIEQVLVCPANAIIDFVVRCVANPGEEVIHPSPGFPTYTAVMQYTGIVGVPVQLREENQFRMNPEDVRRKITEKTKLIIVNSPNNPTGATMTEGEMKEIAALAKERGVYLLSDEAYAAMTYGERFYSPSVYDKCAETTVMLHSFSKEYAMTGWRLGYAVGPQPLIKKMGVMLQTILSCLPVFTQRGAIAALHGSEGADERNRELEKRRTAIVEGLNSLPGVTCLLPGGACYAFPNIQGTGMTSEEFMNFMLEKAGVAVLNGDSFGQYGEGFVRLSYVSTSVEMIMQAIEKMRAALEERRRQM